MDVLKSQVHVQWRRFLRRVLCNHAARLRHKEVHAIDAIHRCAGIAVRAKLRASVVVQVDTSTFGRALIRRRKLVMIVSFAPMVVAKPAVKASHRGCVLLHLEADMPFTDRSALEASLGPKNFGQQSERERHSALIAGVAIIAEVIRVAACQDASARGRALLELLVARNGCRE